MFDFFGDIINFINQIISFINWFFGLILSFIGVFADNRAIRQVIDTLALFPPEILGIVTFCLAVMVFDFVRGRG